MMLSDIESYDYYSIKLGFVNMCCIVYELLYTSKRISQYAFYQTY